LLDRHTRRQGKHPVEVATRCAEQRRQSARMIDRGQRESHPSRRGEPSHPERPGPDWDRRLAGARCAVNTQGRGTRRGGADGCRERCRRARSLAAEARIRGPAERRSTGPAAPAITMLLPFRDDAATRPACLDSIRNRTRTDFEVLCIDDGANYAAAKPLNFLGRQDRRIFVYPSASGSIKGLRAPPWPRWRNPPQGQRARANGRRPRDHSVVEDDPLQDVSADVIL
jgi:hypothetical protein